MKKRYVNPFIEEQVISVDEVLLASGVEFGGNDENEIVIDWPW